MLSALSVLAEPWFPAGSQAGARLRWLGVALSWVFVVELSLRFWVAPRKSRFFRRYWLDLVSVTPLLLPLVAPVAGPLEPVLTMPRALLLLRLFRAGMLVNRRLTARRGVARLPINELSLLATVTLMIVLIAAHTLHYGQGSMKPDFLASAADESGTPEQSLWYSLYTLVSLQPTGGTPSNELGRAVTLALMVGGLAVFGVFVGMVSGATINAVARSMERSEMDLEDLCGHVLVCGWNPSGPAMLRELFGPGNPRDRAVVIVTEHPKAPADLPLEDLPRELVHYVSGDYTRVEILEQIGVKRAAMAILLSDTATARSPQDRDARSVLTALTIDRLNNNIFCCAELINAQHAPLLRLAGVEEIVVSDWVAGVIIGSVGRTRGLVHVLNDLLSASHGNAFYKATLPASWVGLTVGEVHRQLKERHNAILVGVERPVPGKHCQDQVNPPSDWVFQGDDRLVVIAGGPLELQ